MDRSTRARRVAALLATLATLVPLLAPAAGQASLSQAQVDAYFDAARACVDVDATWDDVHRFTEAATVVRQAGAFDLGQGMSPTPERACARFETDMGLRVASERSWTSGDTSSSTTADAAVHANAIPLGGLGSSPHPGFIGASGASLTDADVTEDSWTQTSRSDGGSSTCSRGTEAFPYFQSAVRRWQVLDVLLRPSGGQLEVGLMFRPGWRQHRDTCGGSAVESGVAFGQALCNHLEACREQFAPVDYVAEATDNGGSVTRTYRTVRTTVAASHRGPVTAAVTHQSAKTETTAGTPSSTTRSSVHADVDFTLRHVPDLGYRDLVQVTQGPTGWSRDRTSTFQFQVVAASPGGTHECSLDAAPFSPCQAPYTVGLDDGRHTFAVRYVRSGRAPGSPTTRTWEIDTVAPGAPTITAGPAGGHQPRDAEFQFTSPESDVGRWWCSLDGGVEERCSGGHLLRDLADGTHELRIWAEDHAGNRGAPAIRSWTVNGPAPAPPGPGPAPGGPPTTTPASSTAPSTAPPSTSAAGAPACTGPGVPEVTAGALVVLALDSCLDADTIGGVPMRATSGRIKANGLLLTPKAGTKFGVSTAGGTWTFVVSGPSTLDLNGVEWELPSGFAWNGAIAAASEVLPTLLGDPPPRGQPARQPDPRRYSYAGLQWTALPSAVISTDNGGQAQVSLKLGLPDAFTSFPAGSRVANASAPEVTFGFTASIDQGITVAGKIKTATTAWLGPLRVDALELAYDGADRAFEGSIELRVPPSDATYTAALKLAPRGLFGTSLHGLRVTGSDLNRPLGATGLFLQSLGGQLATEGPHLKLGFDTTVSAGPKLPAPPNTEAPHLAVVSAAVKVLLTHPDVELHSVAVKGSGTIARHLPFDGEITVGPDGMTSIGGSITATITDIEFKAAVDPARSWIAPPGTEGFNLEAAATITWAGLQSRADVVASTRGLVACTGDPGERVGWSWPWYGDPVTLDGTCDLGAFQVPRGPGASAAASAVGRTVRIPAGTKLQAFEATRRGGSPKLVLSGPAGERHEVPADGSPLRNRRLLVLQDEAKGRTQVVLFAPRAGRWRVTTADGSAMGRLRTARDVPVPVVRARVSRRGGRYVLRWRASGMTPATKIHFAERSGRGARPVLTTSRRAGQHTFTPVATSGTHRLEATVLQRDRPRAVRQLAEFAVPPVRAVGRIALDRRGRVVWRAVPGAVSYVVTVTSGGPVTPVTVRRARVRPAPGVCAVRCVVSVTPVTADGRGGRVTTTTLQQRRARREGKRSGVRARAR